jgi:hypothetical protein
MTLSPQDQFEKQPKKEGFAVSFSSKIARVLEYRDSAGRLEFTTDSSDRGDRSITLEHYPKSWPKEERYHLAFSRCRQFLESCGFGVDEWPEEPQPADRDNAREVNPPRFAYTLTAKGEALKPVLGALADWGSRHVRGTHVDERIAAALRDK